MSTTLSKATSFSNTPDSSPPYISPDIHTENEEEEQLESYNTEVPPKTVSPQTKPKKRKKSNIIYVNLTCLIFSVYYFFHHFFLIKVVNILS